MSLKVSQEMVQKLTDAGDAPIMDSVYVTNDDGTHVEKTQGARGLYISSEADGWALRGPFDALLVTSG
jgi:hypothetical protein